MHRYYTVEDYAKRNSLEEKAALHQIKTKKIKQLCSIVLGPVWWKLPPKMKAQPLSLDGLKGGCGKTILSCHLAALLSNLQYRVLLIDVKSSEPMRDCSFVPPR